MIYQLRDDIVGFPDPRNQRQNEREYDGCFAVGGDLSVDRLKQAYAWGIFPWGDFRKGEIYWYCPRRRFVIFPQKVHVSHTMRTLMNKEKFRVTINQAFDQVIEMCSKLRISQKGAWLGPEMVEAYKALYRKGFAHSVEVWDDERLVGGLYGVTMLNGFMGESMFSLEPNASKLALIVLCDVLDKAGAAFIDCQFHTPHLESMGGEFISYDKYLKLLWGARGVPQQIPFDTKQSERCLK